MSRYSYGYSVTASRRTGVRSFLVGTATVVTIVTISAVSGAVVALNLFGSPGRDSFATSETFAPRDGASTVGAASVVGARAAPAVVATASPRTNDKDVIA